jgi:hypothetical protein
VQQLESIKVRPQRVVRDKLWKLDPAVATAADPLAARPLAGPFASVEASCEDARKDDDALLDRSQTRHAWDGSCAGPRLVAIAGKPAAPFDEVVAYQMGRPLLLWIAVRLGRQWYRYLLGDGHGAAGLHDELDYRNCAHIEWTALTLAQVARPVPQLRIKFTDHDTCDMHRMESWGWTESGEVVIGVGASGKPSGIPALTTHSSAWISLYDEDHDKDGPKHKSRSGLTLSWKPDGSLDVGGSAPEVGAGNLGNEAVLGHHMIVFP